MADDPNKRCVNCFHREIDVGNPGVFRCHEGPPQRSLYLQKVKINGETKMQLNESCDFPPVKDEWTCHKWRSMLLQ